jgi:hypothetical protein
MTLPLKYKQWLMWVGIAEKVERECEMIYLVIAIYGQNML